MRPLFGRGVGDNGGQEVTRLPAADVRVVLVLDVLLEDIVVVLTVAVLLASLLSAPAELLGEDCIVFSRADASRSSRSRRAPWGAGATGRRRCGPHCGVPRLPARQLSKNLRGRRARGGALHLRRLRRPRSPIRCSGGRPSGHRGEPGGGRRSKTQSSLHRARLLQRQAPWCSSVVASLLAKRRSATRTGRRRRRCGVSCCCCCCCCRCRRRCYPHRRLPGRVVLTEVLLHRLERTMSLADEGTLRAAPLDLGSGVEVLQMFH